ncbi:hypothetical protein C8Q77DRAFT_18236 [Trametes polyzona]|nr:hypothetical protein C8Q77DRAFT_18236 [Trametes polyzona]
MAILHVALAKLDESRLRESSREEAYEQIHQRMADIPVRKAEVRVGPPINPASTRGYDIMLSIKFDSYEDFQAYLRHPKHVELLERYNPALRDMITFQVDGLAPRSKL